MKRFENKIALVTGGARGIGRATALSLALQGAKVYVADVSENAEQTVADVISAGGVAQFIKVDVSNKAQVSDCIKQIIANDGTLDLAVNNAGIGGVISPLHLVEEKDWDRMIRINLTGQFFCLQEEIKAMLETGGGNIVNVSSLAGVQGVARGGPYSASKHGLVSLTKTAAKEYSTFNIRINAVCPGFIKTDLLDNIPEQFLEFTREYAVPMKRLGEPEEVADTIIYLLSNEATYITGSAIYLDGGMKAG